MQASTGGLAAPGSEGVPGNFELRSNNSGPVTAENRAGQIFSQHPQGVTACVKTGNRSTTSSAELMIDDCLRREHSPITGQLRPPIQVHIFQVHKEVFIKQANIF